MTASSTILGSVFGIGGNGIGAGTDQEIARYDGTDAVEGSANDGPQRLIGDM